MGLEQCCLVLIIHHYWDQAFLSNLPDLSWIMKFSSITSGIIPNSVWAPWTITYNSLELFFPQPQDFPHLSALINTLLNTWVIPCKSPKFSLCAFSPLWYSELQTLAILLFLDSHEHLLNSGNPFGSALVPPPSTSAWKFFQISKLGQFIGLTSFLSHSSGRIIFCYMISSVLKTVLFFFSCFSNLFGFFVGWINLVPVIPFWLEVKVQLFVDKYIDCLHVRKQYFEHFTSQQNLLLLACWHLIVF